MIDINIDVQDTIDEFSLSENQVNNMCSAVSEALTIEIHRNWGEAAKQGLHSTRNNYLKGLIIKKEGVGENSVMLVGKFNNMLENGCEAFDLKSGMMKSLKVKYDKKGNWYLTIPFRFATPGALGENEVFSGVMPQEIYDIIKDKTPTITDGDGNTTQHGDPLTNSEIPLQFQTPTTRLSITAQSIGKVFDQYISKTNIYEGMIRNEKTYQNSTQSTYNTFRRISAKSDPNSWIHPGIAAGNFADKGIDNTQTDIVVNNCVDKILSDYGFGS